MNRDRVYKARLLKLADFLYKLPPKRFYFGGWLGDDWKGAPDLSCGTTACAFGWAAAMPAFRRLGMKWVFSPWHTAYIQWKGSIEVPYAAIGKEIFGLSGYEFTVLFYPSSVAGLGTGSSPRRVAEHIRNFVKNKYPDKAKKTAAKRAH